MCPGMLHAKFQNSRCIPSSPFPRNGQNMALLWPKNGPHMVLKISSSWIIINVPREAPCKISQFRVNSIVLFSKKWPKYGPFVAKTSSLHGPSNWLFLNFNYWTKGYSMPNFIFLGLPISPFLKNGKNMALYGQNMVLIWSLKLVLPESLSICQGMFHAKFHIAGCSF